MSYLHTGIIFALWFSSLYLLRKWCKEALNEMKNEINKKHIAS